MTILNRAWLHTFGFLVILITFAVTASAWAPAAAVPEIDPGSVGAGLAFLAGGYLVLVSKFRRK